MAGGGIDEVAGWGLSGVGRREEKKEGEEEEEGGFVNWEGNPAETLDEGEKKEATVEKHYLPP